MCFLDVSSEVVLKLFGEYFFSFCKMSGYDTMLRTLGGNLLEFIENLDALHSYLALSYEVRILVMLLKMSHCLLLSHIVILDIHQANVYIDNNKNAVLWNTKLILT